MKWQHKAFIFRCIHRLPGRRRLHYFVQRYISRSLPMPAAELEYKSKLAWGHFLAMRKYLPHIASAELVVADMGAGWDLSIPLDFYRFGIGRQVCFDIYPHARRNIIARTITGLRALDAPLQSCGLQFARGLPALPRGPLRQALAQAYGIGYQAPADTAATGCGQATFHVVCSTFVLQYIPPGILSALMQECYRILKPGGIFSAYVDLKDDFSKADTSIGACNFLQYSAKEWDRISPPEIWQNRLRYKDMLQIFTSAGFEILESHITPASEKDMEQLARLKLDSYFQENYSLEETGVKAFNIVLRRPLQAGAV